MAVCTYTSRAVSTAILVAVAARSAVGGGPPARAVCRTVRRGPGVPGPLQEIHREAHVPTQQPPPGQEARLPAPHVRSRRSQRAPLPTAQGSPQAQRLIRPVRYRWEFELLADAGRYRRSGPIAVRTCPLDERRDAGALDDVRVGYAVSRRVGSAVVRNRVRRRLRHAVAALHAAGLVRPGRYLIIAAPQASSASFNELDASLRQLMVSP